MRDQVGSAAIATGVAMVIGATLLLLLLTAGGIYALICLVYGMSQATW